MKRFALVAVAAMVLALAAGCSGRAELLRPVSVVIPDHPWESEGHRMWYSLQYNDGEGLRTLFVENGVREVYLKVPAGRTVYVCAYPLGSLRPFGTGVSPLSEGTVFVLDQDQGVIADLMLKIGEPAVERVNYERLVGAASEVADDFSFLDTELLAQDVYNGDLQKNSVKAKEGVKVTGLEFYQGLWVPENVHSAAFRVGPDGQAPDMVLAEGVHRFLCAERSLEIRIVVSQDGVYKYERPTEMV